MMRLGLALGLVSGALLVPVSAAAQCSVAKELEIPVTMQGLRPMVAVQINGQQARFILDSGAFFSNITPGAAKALGLRLSPAPPNFQLRGIGGATTAQLATVKQMRFADHDFENYQFLVGGSEIDGDGLLGQNVLERAGDIEYDLAHGVVRLMHAGKGCANVSLAYWAAGKPSSTIDIESVIDARFHTQGTVVLNGVKIRAVFDTGAPTTILDSAVAKRAGVTSTSPGVQAAGFTGGLGRGRVKSWIGAFDSLKIGDNEEIRKIRLRFGDIADGNFDMLIGADFFLSHRVYVANGLHKMFITYNGGPVFNLSGADDAPIDNGPAAAGGAVASDAVPGSADEYSRLGAALASRRNFAGAEADFDKAIAMQPQEPRFYVQRARLFAETGEPVKAFADIDQALTLDPKNVDALELRATMRMRHGDRKGARQDVDSLASILPPSANERLMLASLYEALDAPDAAITQYTLWIGVHPEDSRLPEAYNGRCWARAQAGRELPQAISDCDRALHLAPHTAAFLDSRGLAELRAGDLDKARRDYDAALALDPKMAWSLYGRGIARLRQGDKAGGEADVAAAKAINAKLPDEAKAHGITVP